MSNWFPLFEGPPGFPSSTENLDSKFHIGLESVDKDRNFPWINYSWISSQNINLFIWQAWDRSGAPGQTHSFIHSFTYLFIHWLFFSKLIIPWPPPPLPSRIEALFYPSPCQVFRVQPTKSKSQFVTAIAHGQHFGSLTFQVFLLALFSKPGGGGGVVRGGGWGGKGRGVGW